MSTFQYTLTDYLSNPNNLTCYERMFFRFILIVYPWESKLEEIYDSAQKGDRFSQLITCIFLTIYG